MKTSRFIALALAACACFGQVPIPGGSGGGGGDATRAGVQAGYTTVTLSSSGTCTFVGSLTPSLTAYAPGMVIQVKLNHACATSGTLNINGLGAKNIYEQDGTTANTNNSGDFLILIYDAALNASAGGWRKVRPQTVSTALQKGNGTGGFTAATANTDYLGVPSTTGVMYWDGSTAVTAPSRAGLLWVEEFVGQFQIPWQSTGEVGAGGWLYAATTDNNHIGIAELKSGTSSGNRQSAWLGRAGSGFIAGMLLNPQSTVFVLEWIFSIDSYANSTVSVGLGNDSSGNQKAHVYSTAGGAYVAEICSASCGTAGTTITGSAPSGANAWQYVKIRGTGSAVFASVNGGAEFQLTGSNPSVALVPYISVQTNTGSARTLKADYMSIYIPFAGARY